MNRRVVVTGMGGLSALGDSWSKVREQLRAGRTGVQIMPEWEAIDGLKTRLGAPIVDFAVPAHYTRKKTRAMGRVALLATRASEIALDDAGLLNSDELSDGTTGISFGSTSGSTSGIESYANRFFAAHSLRGIGSFEYIKLMSHTCAANLAQFFSIRGRVIPTCSACTSGSQGIGYGYEAIKFGAHDIMLAGGAEELSALDAGVFDILFATSTRNHEPERTPRPFDVGRDGLVVGEGAGALVLEELEHARARGAAIYAEIIGYATNCDGKHLTNPDQESISTVMQLALRDAGLVPGDIDYLNAHGTATEVGDIAESTATYEVFGDGVPCSTLKGHFGHTLGACGALEAWMTIEMMRESWFVPTANLTDVDPRCGPLDYITVSPREISAELVMSNNFAFGGVNTSLVFKRWSDS
jgi:3-oxoacyl-[acyl-carrier-protein] synthase II